MKNILTIISVILLGYSSQAQTPERNSQYYGGEVRGVIIREGFKTHECTFFLKSPVKLHEEVNYLVDGHQSRLMSSPKSQTTIGFMIGKDLWMKKDTKNGVKFCYVHIDGPITMYKYWEKKPEAVGTTNPGNASANLKSNVFYQKLETEAVNNNSIILGFKKKFPAWVSEHPSIGDKIAAKEKGYKAGQIEKVIAEYNTWYIKENSYKVTADKLAVFTDEVEEVVPSDVAAEVVEVPNEEAVEGYSIDDLNKAIKGRDNALVKKMIESGIDLKDFSLSKEHPVGLCLRERNKEALILLLDAKADVNALTSISETALFSVPDHQKVLEGQMELVKMVFANGAASKINHKNKYGGRTPLLEIFLQSHLEDDYMLEMIQLYLDNGADTSVADGNGNTCLILAEKKGWTKAIELLK